MIGFFIFIGIIFIVLSFYVKERLRAPYLKILDEYSHSLICECKSKEDVEKLEKSFYQDSRIFSVDGKYLCKDLNYRYELLSDLFTSTIECWEKIEQQENNTGECKQCNYWKGFFSDKEGKTYCPDCGRLIIKSK